MGGPQPCEPPARVHIRMRLPKVGALVEPASPRWVGEARSLQGLGRGRWRSAVGRPWRAGVRALLRGCVSYTGLQSLGCGGRGLFLLDAGA